MKFLLDIPFVFSLATWVWGGGSVGGGSDVAESGEEDVIVSFGPEFCIESLPLMNGSCWSRLIAKMLGVAIISGAFLNKVPIMLNIWNSQSAAGLSRSATYGDALVVANGAFYGFLEGYPLTSYGENMALLLQTIVIVLLMWKFDKTIDMQERIMVIGGSVAYLIVVCNLLPKEYVYLLPTSVYPVLLISRGTQILETQRLKHTGALSIITTGLNYLGSLARIFTTIAEVGWDMIMLSGFFLSVALNFTMVVQHFAFRENTNVFLKELNQKKD